MGGRLHPRSTDKAAAGTGTLALAGWRLRFGIRAKLFVVVMAIAVMTLLSSLLTWRSYSEVELLLAAVTRGNLPSVSSALKLSEATARMAAAAPALDVSHSHFQRQSNFIALQQQTERLRGLIDSLGGTTADAAQLGELRGMMAAIGDNVAGRNLLVDRRLHLADRMRTLTAATDELDREVHGLLERHHGDPTVTALVGAVDILRSVVAVPTLDKLAARRREYDDEVRRLAIPVDGTGDGVADVVRRAIALGSGIENVFEHRLQQLVTETRLAAANEEGRDLVAQTSSAVGRLVAAAEREAASNERLAEEALSRGRRIMLVISVFTFLGPLAFVWFYVGRNIVGRMAGVAGAMHRIVAGDYQAPIPRSGNDEISDMAAALAVFRDAMARVQESTTALRESEARLRTILDTSPLALAIGRADDTLLYVNPRWCELYLTSEAEAVGRAAASFYDDPSDGNRIVDLVRETGYVGTYETRMRRRDGHVFWAMMSAAAIDVDGEKAVIVSTFDITKRRDQEDALAEAKQLAEEASQAKSLFLATMSHEIRTPMNGVLTMAQLLEDMHLPPEQKEMTRVIRDSAASLLTIINDILDFSRIESGRMQLESIDLSVVDLVEGVAELLSGRALEKGVSLVTYVDPALPGRLRGDPVRVRQIVTNLAGNAIKFTERGHVRIVVEARDHGRSPLTVRFSVTDTGIGLDAEQQARLFEPFIQADATISRRYGGTGLGLSICRRLVTMMGGDIGVTSRVGEGATFWFDIPLTVVSAAPDQGPDLAGIAVLVLAEGPMAAEALRHYLGHLGAQVAVVASTDGAVAAVRAAAAAGWHYDVVLVDGAPDFTLRVSVGRALVAAAGDKAATRVVMLAPHAAYSSAANEARQAGLFATLAKPVHRAALWRTVAAAVGRGLLDEDEPDTAEAEISYLPPGADEAAAAGALILVAEDNPTNQVVIRRLMERLGYAIDLAASGVEAWERMQTRHYGLLLTDCHMPEMDGYELTARVRLRDEDAHGRMPIVALTADALSDTARKCQECGMDAFLAKPVDRRLLDATIRRLLPRAAALRRRADAGGGRAVPDAAGLPVLDLTPMREVFGDVTDEARDLLSLFVESTEPLVGDIRRAVADGDMTAGREAAHSCKGAGNSAGCFRFARLCAEMEQAFLRGDSAAVEALAAPLEAALGEAARAIAAL